MADSDRRLRPTRQEILPPLEDSQLVPDPRSGHPQPPQIIVVQQPAPGYHPAGHQERLGAGGWFTRAFAATSGYLVALMLFSFGGAAIFLFLCCGGLGLFSQAAVENARAATKRLEAENDRKEAELRKLEAADRSQAANGSSRNQAPFSSTLTPLPPDLTHEDIAPVEPKEIKESPDPDTSSSMPGDYPFRQWNSRDGQFSTEAQFVSRANRKVNLRKRDGKLISVDLDRLSEVDEKWVMQPDAKRRSPE